jgi:hypothetical protein
VAVFPAAPNFFPLSDSEKITDAVLIDVYQVRKLTVVIRRATAFLKKSLVVVTPGTVPPQRRL